MKNKFIERILFSIVIIIVGIIEILLKTSSNIYIDYLYILIGIIAFIYTVIDYKKYKQNPKDIDNQLSKEYDERDELVDGKVSTITLKIMIYAILIVLFMSNFIIIKANIALLIILVTFMITEFVARKYYNYTI